MGMSLHLLEGCPHPLADSATNSARQVAAASVAARVSLRLGQEGIARGLMVERYRWASNSIKGGLK